MFFFLSCAPFCDVYKFDNPEDALSVHYLHRVLDYEEEIRRNKLKIRRNKNNIYIYIKLIGIL